MKKQLTEFDIKFKWNKKLGDKIYSLEYKYSKMLGLRKEKLEIRKQKEIARYERKFDKLMDIELHNLTSKRQKKVPEDKTIGKVKKRALAEIQKYRKLKYTKVTPSGKHIIWIYDKLGFVPLDKRVNGGHVYSQRNYPQLAFDENNIRPISSWGNRKQLDTTAEWIVNLPENIQEYLKKKSQEKLSKSELRDRKFYEGIIDKYRALNEIEEKRLGIT